MIKFVELWSEMSCNMARTRAREYMHIEGAKAVTQRRQSRFVSPRAGRPTFLNSRRERRVKFNLQFVLHTNEEWYRSKCALLSRRFRVSLCMYFGASAISPASNLACVWKALLLPYSAQELAPCCVLHHQRHFIVILVIDTEVLIRAKKTSDN